MPRYELSEGSSNKFWEIELDGSSFTTTYGKIGTDGQSTTKEFDSDAEAKRQYDKLIAEKEKKGYQLVGGPSPAAKASMAAFESKILGDPDNPAHYIEYGKWLDSQNNPLGELVAIQVEQMQNPSNTSLADKEKKLIEKHRAAILGDLASVEDFSCTWKYGFLYSATLGTDEWPSSTGIDTYQTLFKHPAAKFLRELNFAVLGSEDDGELEYGDLLKTLKKIGLPPLLRSLSFDVGGYQISWSHLGDLSALYPQLQKLEALKLKIGSMKLGSMELPNLRSFEVITGGLTKGNLKSISGANWPELESLVVYFGDDNYGCDCTVKELSTILSGKGLSNVRKLGLANSKFADELPAALAKAKILPQLEELDLSKGTMTAKGAEALLANADKFKHLKKLDLTQNFIPDNVVVQLRAKLPQLTAQGQEKPDGDYLYVQVAE